MAFKSLLLTVGLSILMVAPAHALTAKQKVEKEVVKIAADGTTQIEHVPADLVMPGETVVYTINFTNDGADPASDLVLAMPVPQDINFIEGSAERAASQVRYSADGGTNYQFREALILPAVGGGTRQATAEDITHIQWKLTEALPVGASGSVAFKGKLK